MAQVNGSGAETPSTGVGQEKINIDIVTLTRFLTEEQAKHKEATGDFTYVGSDSLTQIYSPPRTVLELKWRY